MELKHAAASLQDKITSVPAEVIDPVMTASKIAQKEKDILQINAKKIEAQRALDEDKVRYEKIEDFLETFEIEKYKKKKESFTETREELDSLIFHLKELSAQKTLLVLEQDKLCTSCIPLIGETVEKKSLEMSLLSKEINSLGTCLLYTSPSPRD